MEYKVVDIAIREQENVRQTISDLLAAELGDAGYESFVETEEGLQAYIPSQLFDRDSLEKAIQNIPMEADLAYDVAEMEDQDWNQTWEEQGFEPICVGGRCTIYDARHTDREALEAQKEASEQQKEALRQQAEALNIFIETRQAFGSGTHQTTQMMVENILDCVKPGMKVLDFGCGTGILGIAASKCGAAEVLGYDIDPWSAENARHNAQLNGVENMEVLLGDTSLLVGSNRKFDLILANINRNIVISDMATLRSVMAPGALLIASGFFEADIAAVAHRATELGLAEIGRKVNGEWSCVVFAEQRQ